MKKIIAIISFCVVSFVSFNSQASTPDGLDSTSVITEVKKAINKVMIYPVFQKQKMQGTVEVSFKIDQQGKVDIVHIESSNPELIEYVVKKLNQIKLKEGQGYNGQTIRYKFVFKKEA